MDKENLTEKDIWDEEMKARSETSTAKAADEPPVEPEVTEPEEAPPAPGDNPEEGTSAEEPDLLTQILEKVEKLEGRTRHVEGHIGGLKTAHQSLKTAMEEARKSASKDDSDAPTKRDVEAASKNPEKWEELKQDFPEWAEATEQLLASRGTGLDEGTVDQMIQERLEQATAKRRQEDTVLYLNGVLPGWQEEVKTEKFGSWLGEQEEEIKALASSDEYADAAKLLRLYDRHLQDSPARAIQEDRKQKLAQATALPRTRTAPQTKTLDQMTEAEVWDYEAKQREKRRAAQGY